MTALTGRPRSEIELFNALAGGADQAELDEYRKRVLKCVLWLLAQRPSGPLVVGDVGDMVAEVIARLEEHLRPRGSDERGRRFVGSDAQFRRYLYLTVTSVYADTVNVRVRLRSLDAPIETLHGNAVVLGDLLDGLREWPTAGDDLGRPDIQAWVQETLRHLPERSRRWLLAFHLDGVPIKDIARRHATRRNTVEVALSRGRACFRRAFLDAFLTARNGQFRARVDEATRRLPEPHRAVFSAYWVDGRNPSETATMLGLPRNTVKTLLVEAKERVWRMLPEGGTS